MINNHRIKRFLQHGRIGIGVIALAFPGLIPRLLGIERTAGTKLLMRLFGTREIGIGAGQMAAERGGDDRRWFLTGAAIDAGDGVVLLGAAIIGKTPRLRALVFTKLAFVAAIAGVIIATEEPAE